MLTTCLPLRALLLTVSGWVHREQQRAIDYLVEENRVLKEQLGTKRLRLTDTQRRRLAAKGKLLGRRLLGKLATVVTPDTIMRWHRRLIAAKWTYPQPAKSSAGVMLAIKRLVLRMATENATWGYSRIQGELEGVGHRVGRSTIARILKAEGIQPAPDRPTSWRTFLNSHWGQVAACDFFTSEVWTAKGLVTYYTLFVIDLKTRIVEIAGSTPNPDSAWMTQVARNLTDTMDGFLRGHRFLLCDRDSIFSARWRTMLKREGVRVVQTPHRAPNANAYAERFVRSIKSECLRRMMMFGERGLQRALREYAEHYNKERPHQGFGNRPLLKMREPRPTGATEVLAMERLGGLLRTYRRWAA
jgi:transposase InsO family protein